MPRPRLRGEQEPLDDDDYEPEPPRGTRRALPSTSPEDEGYDDLRYAPDTSRSAARQKDKSSEKRRKKDKSSEKRQKK